MVWAGIYQYYTTAEGFGDSMDMVLAMYKGLRGSGCSIEIQSHADGVAKMHPQLLEED